MARAVWDALAGPLDRQAVVIGAVALVVAAAACAPDRLGALRRRVE